MIFKKMDVLDKVHHLLLELEVFRLEWFLVLTDTEGKQNTRGSELGTEFLKVSRDITDRFLGFCRNKEKFVENKLAVELLKETHTSENFNQDVPSGVVGEAEDQTRTHSKRSGMKNVISSVNDRTSANICEENSQRNERNSPRGKRQNRGNKDATCHIRGKNRKLAFAENKNNQMQDKQCRSEEGLENSVSDTDNNKKPDQNMCLNRNMIVSSHTSSETSIEPPENVNLEVNSNLKNCKTCDEIFTICDEAICSQSQTDALMALKFQYHRREHVDKETSVRTCSICSKEQSTLESLVEHIILAHSDENLEENETLNNDKDKAKSTPETENISVDLPQTDDDKINSLKKMEKLTVPLCGTNVLNNSNPERDVKRSHNEKMFFCNQCDMQFTQEHEFEKHVETHIPTFESDVDNFGGTLTTKVGSVGRMMKHDRNMCWVCGKICPTESKLKYHMTYHNETRIHKCDVCDKSFKTKDVLNKHERTHRSTRHYYCEICGVGFDQSGALQRHKLVHTDIKPHRCNICGVEYRNLSSLKAHKLRDNHYDDNDKEKNLPILKCGVCGKEFLTISGHEYKRHILTHSGEKPYTCDVCNKSFNDKSNLRQHHKIHSNDRPHSCGTCNRQFIQPRSLRKHLAQSGHSGTYSEKTVEAVKEIVKKTVDTAKEMVKKDDISILCVFCNRHFMDWESLHNHISSSEHRDKNTVEAKKDSGTENQGQMQVSQQKPPPAMSNFELLSVAASHMEKLAENNNANVVLSKKLVKNDLISPDIPAVEQKLDKIENTLSYISQNSKDPEKLPPTSSQADNKYESEPNTLNADIDATEIISDSGPDGKKSCTKKSYLQKSDLSGECVQQSPGIRILKHIPNTVKVVENHVLPSSKIILLKVKSEPVQMSVESGSIYTSTITQESSSTLQTSSMNTINTSYKLIPVKAFPAQGTGSLKGNKGENKDIPTSYISRIINTSMPGPPYFHSSMNGSPGFIQNKSQYHGTILRKSKPCPVITCKQNPITTSILQDSTLQDMNSEPLNHKTISDSPQTTVNSNNNSGKISDFSFDSETIMNSESTKCENMDMNTYFDENGNSFIDSPTKSPADSENILSNANTDNGNIFLNFLQEEPFSQNSCFSKPVTTERQFDPFFYTNPTTPVYGLNTSADVWPGSISSLPPAMQQDSKYNSVEPVYSVPFSSSSEPVFTLPVTSASTE